MVSFRFKRKKESRKQVALRLKREDKEARARLKQEQEILRLQKDKQQALEKLQKVKQEEKRLNPSKSQKLLNSVIKGLKAEAKFVKQGKKFFFPKKTKAQIKREKAELREIDEAVGL